MTTKMNPHRRGKGAEVAVTATASSPARGADADLEEAVATSSGVRSPGDWDEPLAAPPVSSAPPREFARMPSLSLGSDDEFETTR